MKSTSSKADMPAETSYPHVARWVRDCGWVEIGQDDFSRCSRDLISVAHLGSHARLEARFIWAWRSPNGEG